MVKREINWKLQGVENAFKERKSLTGNDQKKKKYQSLKINY